MGTVCTPILCLMIAVVHGVDVRARVAERVHVKCEYPAPYADGWKYFCKGQVNDCNDLIRTRAKKNWVTNDRLSLCDNGSSYFIIRLANLNLEDAGIYQCGVNFKGSNWNTMVNLLVTDDMTKDINVTAYAGGRVYVKCGWSSEDDTCTGQSIAHAAPVQKTHVPNGYIEANRSTLYTDASGRVIIGSADLTTQDTGQYHCPTDLEGGVPTGINMLVEENPCCGKELQLKVSAGEDVNITCPYLHAHANGGKFFCKSYSQHDCRYKSLVQADRVWVHPSSTLSLYDDREAGVLTVTVRSFKQYSEGSHWCGLEMDWEMNGYKVLFTNVKLTLKDVECKLGLLNSSVSTALPPTEISSLLDVLLVTPPDSLASKGDAVLQSTENLVSTLVKPTPTQSSTNFSTNTTVVEILSVGPNSSLTGVSQLVTANVSVDIDLLGIAQNNNGSASVVFMVYKSMHEALNGSFFKTEDSKTADIMSNVISIILPKTQNTTLPRPVNISIQHLRPVGLGNELWCVYWNVTGWIKDGCHVSANNSTRTVCSCGHLSTFALIMTVNQKLKSDCKMDVLNTILVFIGLVFLTLAVMTFVLCRWNPRVSNAARLNLCVCLLLAHTLFLLTQSFLGRIRIHQVLCRILAGVLHFLFLCSFMWMSIEAVMLFLSVRKLRQVKASDRAGLHWKINLLIGYGIPLFIVGVSAGVKPDGHGSEDCWLKDGFVWSFLGPVCFLLAVNIILFLTIIITLQSTLKEARSDVSKVKYTRVLLFKITVQCIVLGCPWVLGIFSAHSCVLEVLFLFLTSQQGTAIFLIHCLLNTEVRRQYRLWWQRFGPSSKQPESGMATVSISLTQQPTSTTTATSRVACS
ncbi:hypothetical protein ACEWY4_017381 [Coilia grayii]|uniref:Adhesion G protein-coupled receptor E3-like n=1 Tax=Coilia grayii TaxID=363190 RepID=A0ABD1JGZ6_9TELE